MAEKTELEQLVDQLSHLNIDQMLELVKKSDNRFDRRFKATGLKGSIEGTIIDPYLGLIEFDVEGEIGTTLASSLRFHSDITYQLI